MRPGSYGCGNDARARSVILYELNEVPWPIVDLYTKHRPESNLGALLASGQALTTVDDDPAALSPWRTWPTLHKSMYTEQHNSYELGQDPQTFRGDSIWDVVDRAGMKVGVFGALQSWPPRDFRAGGFYVPDTFAQDPDCRPTSLRQFQKFNLAMTRQNTFSSDTPLEKSELLRTVANLVREGLTPYSVRSIGTHLFQETRDRRYKASRPIIQVLPSFDLFWRQHRRLCPRLSIFFTNHVASMMHRFWGDAVPEYASIYEYNADEIYQGFVIKAMDLADHHLGVMRRYMERSPGTVLILSASMGQGPVPPETWGDNLLVLEDVDRLAGALGLEGAEAGMAMYPLLAISFPTEVAATAAIAPMESVMLDGNPLFDRFNVQGRTLMFGIDFLLKVAGPDPQLSYRPLGATVSSQAGSEMLGISVRSRLGGGNTAYHVPEGMLLACGPGIVPGATRDQVDILDVSPSILANVLDIDPAPSMRGKASLFAESTLLRN